MSEFESELQKRKNEAARSQEERARSVANDRRLVEQEQEELARRELELQKHVSKLVFDGIEPRSILGSEAGELNEFWSYMGVHGFRGANELTVKERISTEVPFIKFFGFELKRTHTEPEIYVRGYNIGKIGRSAVWTCHDNRLRITSSSAVSSRSNQYSENEPFPDTDLSVFTPGLFREIMVNSEARPAKMFGEEIGGYQSVTYRSVVFNEAPSLRQALLNIAQVHTS